MKRMDPAAEAALFEQAAAALPRAFFESRPARGLILGSGWSQALAGAAGIRIPYGQIPGLGASTVRGHAGELLLLEAGGTPTAIFCGRRHWYEGEGWTPVILPVELLRRMGVRQLVLTNAAGGIHPQLRPGDLLLIRDHVNMGGLNPLQGPVRPGWGTRFPDQSRVYDPELAARLQACAAACEVPLRDGVYAFTAGPAYETPAEIRAYGLWGVDAVGMSTVPEAMVAHAMGMRVAALSCITNLAAGISGPHLSHEEVLAETRRMEPLLARLLRAILTAPL